MLPAGRFWSSSPPDPFGKFPGELPGLAFRLISKSSASFRVRAVEAPWMFRGPPVCPETKGRAPLPASVGYKTKVPRPTAAVKPTAGGGCRVC